MESSDTPKPSLDLGAEHLFQKFLKTCYTYRYSIFSTFLFGFLSYLFVFTNKLLNHDELGNLFGLGASISSGRWGLEIIAHFIAPCSMPWLNGITTLILMSAAICLMIRIFSIRSHLLQVLLSGLIIVFPSLIGTFGYMFTSTCYGLAFLLSVLSVFCFVQNKPFPILAGIVCCTFSLGIYQAYISVAASLLVLYLIRETLYTQEKTGRIFRKGVCFAALLIISLALYWGISQMFILHSDTEMNAYAQNAISQSRSIPARIKDCIFFFYYVFSKGFRALYYPVLSQVLHIFCGVIICLELLFWMCRKKHLKRLPLLLLLLILFPISVTSILLIVSYSSVHTLVVYSFISLYVLAAVVIEGNLCLLSRSQLLNKVRTLLMDLTLFSMAAVIACNIFLANKAYLNMYLNYFQNYSFATTLITRVETTPGYTEDMPVVIVGQYPTNPFMDEFSGMEALTGVEGISTKNWSYSYLFEYYCGTRLNLVNELDPEQLSRIQNSREFQKMGTYPDSDFLRIMDGQVIVKLPPAKPMP